MLAIRVQKQKGYKQKKYTIEKIFLDEEIVHRIAEVCRIEF